MKKRFVQKKKRKIPGIWGTLLPVLFFICIAGLFYLGVNGISQTGTREGLVSAQKAVTKAALQCYALEGQYPPNVAYLVDNYGLSVNQDKYIIHYESIASNIMPQVIVMPRER